MLRLLLLLSACLPGLIYSQQDGYQTHFQFNEISYNPSYAGKDKNKICISSLIHQQYLGFKSDAITDYENKVVISPYSIAPQTQYFSISGRCVQRLGIAFQFTRDEIGPQTIKLPKINLSWYFNINQGELSIGMYMGQMQKSLDGNKLVPLSQLQSPAIPDPNVPSTMVNSKKFDAGIGMHYRNPILCDLNIGFALTHLMPSGFYFINSIAQSVPFSSIKTHYYFNAAIDLPSGISQLLIQPNLLIKYGSRFQTDLNVLGIWNQAIYGGISFRQEDNINFMLGFIRKELKIGYAFDAIVNELKPGTKSSHEIFIQYCFIIKNKPGYLLNPRYLHDSTF